MTQAHRRIIALSIVVLVSGITSASLAAAPQTPRDLQMPSTLPAARGTGVIAGTLAMADSGKPVRLARVTISAFEPRVNKTVITTDQGRFSFAELPPAQYTLTASKPGLLDVTYGQRRPGNGREGTPIQLAAGQKLENIALGIPRGGVITGTVLDEAGDPAFGVTVRALRYVMKGGVRAPLAGSSGITDDRGIYRIPALLPGDYLVTAVPANTAQAEMMKVEEMRARAEDAAIMARTANTQAATEKASAMLADARMMMDKIAAPADEPTEAYVPVYYPNTANPTGAAVVTLDISEEHGAIDLQLQRQPVGRISGVIVSADAAQPPNATVWLIDSSNVVPGIGTRITRTLPDGRFSFSSIPAGQYTLLATATLRQSDTPRTEMAMPAAAPKDALEAALARANTVPVWARADIASPGRALDGVTLTLQRGMTISGIVTVEGATSQANLGRLTLTAGPGRAARRAVGGRTLRDGGPGRRTGTLHDSRRDPWRVSRGTVDGRRRIEPEIRGVRRPRRARPSARGEARRRRRRRRADDECQID